MDRQLLVLAGPDKARDPDGRFQTAGELLAELDRIASVLGA